MKSRGIKSIIKKLVNKVILTIKTVVIYNEINFSEYNGCLLDGLIEFIVVGGNQMKRIIIGMIAVLLAAVEKGKLREPRK